MSLWIRSLYFYADPAPIEIQKAFLQRPKEKRF